MNPFEGQNSKPSQNQSIEATSHSLMAQSGIGIGRRLLHQLSRSGGGGGGGGDKKIKIGIPEFLSGIGRGVEAHAGKLEAEIGDLPRLLETRTLRLKKLEIPCNHRKLILSYAHKFRLGLWRPHLPHKP